jgi:ribokinase
MGRVVVLGSLNLDLVTQVDRHPEPGETVLGEGLQRLAGGKGANQAMAAAAAGAEVSMIGAVGDDEAGRAYVERLRSAGIDTSGVAVMDDEPTGTALIVVGEGAENTIVVVPGANGRVDQAALAPLDEMTPDDVLLVQLEIPLETVAAACARAAERGVRVVLNIAPYADLPAAVVQAADPLVANEHEAQLLGQTGTRPRSRLVTLGPHGAVWDDLGLPAVDVPDDEVLDTTGAGDAFCGALAAALARGEDREQAMQAALEAGGAAVRRRGAQPDPTLGRGEVSPSRNRSR